jgi:hypothetical protein
VFELWNELLSVQFSVSSLMLTFHSGFPVPLINVGK